MNESRIFAQEPDPKTEKKGFQSKNNEARQQDHGKDYLFGTQSIYSTYNTDNNDHKQTLRRVQTAKVFEPKMDYDPTDRRMKELYGTEISKDHLPVKAVEAKKRVDTKKKDTDYDPENRKLVDSQSEIFNGEKRYPSHFILVLSSRNSNLPLN